MNPIAIVYPMAALVLLTSLVLTLIPYQRFKAGRARQVTMDDFRYGESASVPPEVSIPNRNYMNLLQMPVLFYVGCLTLYVTQTVDALSVELAWAYVATRVGHSAVHLTYNKVLHRLMFFTVSNGVLAVLWIHLVMSLPKN